MRRLNFRSMIIVLAVAGMSVMPFISQAKPLTASILIVNNSSRAIRNVYLAHVDSDDWGDNQLGSGTISSGESFTISNISWDQSQVKVVAEDQDGCFLSAVVAASQSSTWTISNSTAADCGGGSSSPDSSR